MTSNPNAGVLAAGDCIAAMALASNITHPFADSGKRGQPWGQPPCADGDGANSEGHGSNADTGHTEVPSKAAVLDPANAKATKRAEFLGALPLQDVTVTESPGAEATDAPGKPGHAESVQAAMPEPASPEAGVSSEGDSCSEHENEVAERAARNKFCVVNGQFQHKADTPFKPMRGCEWWQEKLHHCTSHMRIAAGQPLRRPVHHDLCCGVGTATIVAEAGHVHEHAD